ncbi:MAG: transcriptional repressor [Candidatus Aminicenantales bacterium]
MDLLRKKCRESRLKMTPQRALIYKELVKSKDHPSADHLHKRVKQAFPNISFDTVNRTLLTFARIGLVDIVEGSGEPRRFDPERKNHHHFRCIACRTIFDFNYKLYDDMVVPGSIKKKFSVQSKKVLLEGYCDKCRKID